MSVDDVQSAPEKGDFVDPLDIPNLDQDGVFDYLILDLDIPATRHMVKWAFLRREMIPVRLGNSNYVSRRDVLNWIESRRQPGTYRLNVPPEAVSE